jgi:hypothetical protein
VIVISEEPTALSAAHPSQSVIMSDQGNDGGGWATGATQRTVARIAISDQGRLPPKTSQIHITM